MALGLVTASRRSDSSATTTLEAKVAPSRHVRRRRPGDCSFEQSVRSVQRVAGQAGDLIGALHRRASSMLDPVRSARSSVPASLAAQSPDSIADDSQARRRRSRHVTRRSGEMPESRSRRSRSSGGLRRCWMRPMRSAPNAARPSPSSTPSPKPSSSTCSATRCERREAGRVDAARRARSIRRRTDHCSSTICIGRRLAVRPDAVDCQTASLTCGSIEYVDLESTRRRDEHGLHQATSCSAERAARLVGRVGRSSARLRADGAYAGCLHVAATIARRCRPGVSRTFLSLPS